MTTCIIRAIQYICAECGWANGHHASNCSYARGASKTDTGSKPK